MRKIKKCSKLCVFLHRACSAKIRNIKVKAKPQENFSSCGFAFLKRIDYKGVTAFIAVVLFLLVKIISVCDASPNDRSRTGLPNL